MPIIEDPEKNEINALFSICNQWDGKSLLEIGSGDGRLTWEYAEKVARVLALEPNKESHTLALENHPPEMTHIEFLNLGFEKFAHQNQESFDFALLSWSL